jgi:hypothetical protein
MRSESDMIAKSPVQVTLGDVNYDIKPLPILKARKWRTLLAATMNELVGTLQENQSKDNMGPALTAALVRFPEKMAELIFEWSPELPKDKIIEEATEEQLSVAYSKVMQFAYPFLAQVQTTIQVVKSR